MINADTRLYGIIGSPVRHSLSPAMHNAAFSHAGQNAVYLAFEVRDVEGAVRGIRAMGMGGVSVTVPHKETIIPLLDRVDETAARIGAVNTVVNRNGLLEGFNTDMTGAARALEQYAEISGTDALVL